MFLQVSRNTEGEKKSLFTTNVYLDACNPAISCLAAVQSQSAQ